MPCVPRHKKTRSVHGLASFFFRVYIRLRRRSLSCSWNINEVFRSFVRWFEAEPKLHERLTFRPFLHSNAMETHRTNCGHVYVGISHQAISRVIKPRILSVWHCSTETFEDLDWSEMFSQNVRRANTCSLCVEVNFPANNWWRDATFMSVYYSLHWLIAPTSVISSPLPSILHFLFAGFEEEEEEQNDDLN